MAVRVYEYGGFVTGFEGRRKIRDRSQVSEHEL